MNLCFCRILIYNYSWCCSCIKKILFWSCLIFVSFAANDAIAILPRFECNMFAFFPFQVSARRQVPRKPGRWGDVLWGRLKFPSVSCIGRAHPTTVIGYQGHCGVMSLVSGRVAAPLVSITLQLLTGQITADMRPLGDVIISFVRLSLRTSLKLSLSGRRQRLSVGWGTHANL